MKLQAEVGQRCPAFRSDCARKKAPSFPVQWLAHVSGRYGSTSNRENSHKLCRRKSPCTVSIDQRRLEGQRNRSETQKMAGRHSRRGRGASSWQEYELGALIGAEVGLAAGKKKRRDAVMSRFAAFNSRATNSALEHALIAPIPFSSWLKHHFPWSNDRSRFPMAG